MKQNICNTKLSAFESNDFTNKLVSKTKIKYTLLITKIKIMFAKLLKTVKFTSVLKG